MVQLHPLYLAVLTTQDLAARLAQVESTVQYVLASPPQGPLGGWLVPRQLEQINSTMTVLAELLGHIEGQEIVQCVATLLGHARIMAQDDTAPGEPSQGALRQLAEQLELTQAAFEALTAQLHRELEQSAAGRFLEESPRTEAGGPDRQRQTDDLRGVACGRLSAVWRDNVHLGAVGAPPDAGRHREAAERVARWGGEGVAYGDDRPATIGPL